jgi:hypothetical protein
MFFDLFQLWKKDCTTITSTLHENLHVFTLGSDWVGNPPDIYKGQRPELLRHAYIS